MKSEAECHAMDGLVLDYINGHLTGPVKSQFEAALVDDPELRKLIDFQKRIQSAARTPQEGRLPSFEKLQPKLGNRWNTPSLFWIPWAVSATLVLALIGLAGSLTWQRNIDDGYEVLSDPPVNYDQPILRLTTNNALSEVAFNELLEKYDVTVIQKYPNTKFFDVAPKAGVNIQLLAKQLEQDDRVGSVNVIGD